MALKNVTERKGNAFLATDNCDGGNERLAKFKWEYIDHRKFHRNGTDELLTYAPNHAKQRRQKYNNVPIQLASLLDHPLLTSADEIGLFLKMNYAKYKGQKLALAGALSEANELMLIAISTRNHIIICNQRLILMAVKNASANHNIPLEEMMSSGNVTLLRAVEKFDIARGFKFSTYATNCILRNLNSYYKQQLPLNMLPLVESPIDESMLYQEIDNNDDAQALLNHLNRLNEREHYIINHRFGLNGNQQWTLKGLGARMGLTKERVRQIEFTARAKLRSFVR